MADNQIQQANNGGANANFSYLINAVLGFLTDAVNAVVITLFCYWESLILENIIRLESDDNKQFFFGWHVCLV